jgi:hypothetical protein
MKRLSLLLLLIGILFAGNTVAQAVVVVAPGPYYPVYYRHWHRYWAPPYRIGAVPVAAVPAPAYAQPAPYYPYYYAPAPVITAPILPVILGLGLHIR